jgi:23S rRNA pseudouridine2605 synthase
VLERGVGLDDGVTSPSKIRPVHSPPFNYAIIIHEGRNRQVRRMFASVGFQVLELKRIRIETVTIAGLSEGDSRKLTSQEIKSLNKT